MFRLLGGVAKWAFSRGAAETAETAAGAAAKGSLLTTAKNATIVAGGGAVLGLGVPAAIWGPNAPVVGTLITNLMQTWARAGAETGPDAAFQAFYKSIEKLADLIANTFGEGGISTGLRNWALINQEKDPVNPHNDVTTTNVPAVNTGLTVTASNEISVNNLTVGLSDIANVDLGHKAHVLGHGLAEGGVHVVNILGHAADLGDTIIGGTLGVFGARDWWGDEQRDISGSFHAAAMNNVVNPLIGVPELKTAWDRVLHGAGEIAPSLLVGNFASASLGVTGLVGTNIISGVVSTPAIDAALDRGNKPRAFAPQ